MSTKEKDAPAATVASKDDSLPENHSSVSLSELPEVVNECLNLRAYISKTNSMAKDVAQVVKDEFPKFNRQLLTQCSSPEKYGIIIHPRGLEVIKSVYGISEVRAEASTEEKSEQEKPPKKKQRRKLSRAITLRMTTKDYQKLARRVKEDGFTSVQAWLYIRVSELLKEVPDSV